MRRLLGLMDRGGRQDAPVAAKDEEAKRPAQSDAREANESATMDYAILKVASDGRIKGPWEEIPTSDMDSRMKVACTKRS